MWHCFMILTIPLVSFGVLVLGPVFIFPPFCCWGTEMYSLLLETYIKDQQEKNRLFQAMTTVPAVQRKAEWALKWIGRCASGS